MTPTQLEAKRKIEKAMRLVEHAQRTLGDACGELCPIENLCPEWEHVGKLYDKVHAAWYKLQNKLLAGRFDLDSDAKARFNANSAVRADHSRQA